MEAVMDPDSLRNQTIEKLIQQYQTPLLRLCYIQLQDRTLAEDAVQETFLKAYRGFAQFRGESSEKTWLTRIAVNVCRDYQRGSWFRHTDRSITPDMLQIGTEQPDTEDMDLSMAVMKLPRKMREAILLYYYQDMGTEEIAKVLGLTQSTVSYRLQKSREKLRKLLEGRDQDA
jgi:RNA polymerase sigma-70 factor (ECF subfamily)